MNGNASLNRARRIGIGLAFIIFPLVFVFAFGVHHGLLEPSLRSPTELILRAHHDELLHFAHVLVLFNTGLLIVVALHFMKLLESTDSAWSGFIGAIVAILGVIFLATDKGALCLTMSAFDTLPETGFNQIMPGMLAMFTRQGWLALLHGIMILPLGFAIQAVALIRTRAIARWQSILFLIGVLFVGTPDGLEIVNLTASVLMAIALVPYGIQVIKEAW